MVLHNVIFLPHKHRTTFGHFPFLLTAAVFRFPLLLRTLGILSNVVILSGFSDIFVMIRVFGRWKIKMRKAIPSTSYKEYILTIWLFITLWFSSFERVSFYRPNLSQTYFSASVLVVCRVLGFRVCSCLDLQHDFSWLMLIWRYGLSRFSNEKPFFGPRFQYNIYGK